MYQLIENENYEIILGARTELKLVVSEAERALGSFLGHPYSVPMVNVTMSVVLGGRAP